MLRIRPAQASDATFLAWAMPGASRSHLPKGWFDIVLERPEADCIEFLRRLAVTQARSWRHYSRFHVAEVDDERAATLCVFRAGDAYPLSGAAMAEAGAYANAGFEFFGEKRSVVFAAATGAPGLCRYVKRL